MKSTLVFLGLVLFGFWSIPSEARGNRFLRHQGHIKGFNPCGWNTCRVGAVFRRPVRRGIFRRRIFRGRCRQGGSCQPIPRQQNQAPNSLGHSQGPGQSRGIHPQGGPLEQAPSLNPVPQRPEAPPDLSSRDNASETLTDEQKAGARVFTARCASCHEENGPGPDFSNWTEEDWKTALKRSHLGNEDKRRMPPLTKPALSEEELKSLKVFLEHKAGIRAGKEEPDDDLIEAPAASEP